MLLDIVILPPSGLRKKLGKKIKSAVNPFPHIFVVDNKKFIPHISLFHIHTSKKKIREMSKIIKKILVNHRAIKMSSIGFDVGLEPGQSWFGVSLNNSKELRQLHKEVVYSCRDLRTGKMPTTSKKITKLELEYRENFGSRHILKLFYPHITLAMLKNIADTKTIEKQWKGLKINLTPKEVAITKVNYWHQVTKIIKKFKFGSNSRE